MSKSLLKRILSYLIHGGRSSKSIKKKRLILTDTDFFLPERGLAETRQMISEVPSPNEIEKHKGEPFDIDKSYPIRENMRCATINDFLERVWTDIDKINIDRTEEYFTLDNWMISILRTNEHLPFVQAIMEIKKEEENIFFTRHIYERMLLILLATEYHQHKDRDDVGMTLGEIDLFFPEEFNSGMLRSSLWRGVNILFSMGYITHKNIGEGVIDRSWFVITDKTKALLDDNQTTKQPNF